MGEETLREKITKRIENLLKRIEEDIKSDAFVSRTSVSQFRIYLEQARRLGISTSL